jgi:hypothetical protein
MTKDLAADMQHQATSGEKNAFSAVDAVIDRARELSVVALTNTLYEGMSGAFVNPLRDAVYASIAARSAS